MQTPHSVVGPQYCAPYAVEFTVVKAFWSVSGGDFVINDSHGNVFFKVVGRTFSIRNKRVLLDRQGSAVVCALRKIFSLHQTWFVYRGDGNSTSEADRLFTVKRSAVIQLKTTLHVFLASNISENEPDFKVQGNYFERRCTIYRGNETIAEVKRQLTAGNVLLGKDTFVVTIFPGIDHAFIAMLIVILDEIHREKE